MLLRPIAHQMLPVRRKPSREAEQSEVVRLGAAAGEDQFVRLHFQECGKLIARVINRGARLAAGAMNTRWIAEMFFQIRPHRPPGWLAEWRRGVVIEVDHAVSEGYKD